ncbi:phosphotransferase family protein [Corynebacterium sp. A21]|uniref:phosphotransferase family protein n=1 Tax=Corynebacterium sp. A21 TaxID=3457318 RepID=UPI003FD1F200
MSTTPSATSLPAMVRSAYPDLHFDQVEFPRQGLDHAVAILRGGADGPLVARAPHSDDYRAQAATEAAVLSTLAPLVDAALPRPVCLLPDGSLALQTLVRGTPAEGPWPAAASRQLGQLLSVLHSRDISREPFHRVQGWRAAGGLSTAPRALPAKIALLQERAAQYLPGVLPAAALRDIEKIFSDTDVLLDGTRPARLIHSDLYADHLLWDGTRLGVIDFSDMNLGDPAVDFAHLPDPTAVLEHYEAEPDEGLLDRAGIYRRWDAVYLLVDHLRTGRTPGGQAWTEFELARAQL